MARMSLPIIPSARRRHDVCLWRLCSRLSARRMAPLHERNTKARRLTAIKLLVAGDMRAAIENQLFGSRKSSKASDDTAKSSSKNIL